jgi:hypothetical protein
MDVHFDDRQFYRTFGQSAHPMPCLYGGHYGEHFYYSVAVALFKISLFRFGFLSLPLLLFL